MALCRLGPPLTLGGALRLIGCPGPLDVARRVVETLGVWPAPTPEPETAQRSPAPVAAVEADRPKARAAAVEDGSPAPVPAPTAMKAPDRPAVPTRIAELTHRVEAAMAGIAIPEPAAVLDPEVPAAREEAIGIIAAARTEAGQILEAAWGEADQIIAEARGEADLLITTARALAADALAELGDFLGVLGRLTDRALADVDPAGRPSGSDRAR